MPDVTQIRVTSVTLRTEGECRGSYLKEYNVCYTVSGKSFEVLAFHDQIQGWSVMTAHLDNAIAEYVGHDYFQMTAKTRHKYRREIADRLIRLTKKQA